MKGIVGHQERLGALAHHCSEASRSVCFAWNVRGPARTSAFRPAVGPTSSHRRVYFAGDTGYSTHFSDIRNRLGSPDIAMLGIGAYEPRWFMKSIHMNPAEAVCAHRDLGTKQSIGMHFGTFQLTTEAIDQPCEDLAQALSDGGIPKSQFIVLHEGETRVF